MVNFDEDSLVVRMNRVYLCVGDAASGYQCQGNSVTSICEKGLEDPSNSILIVLLFSEEVKGVDSVT